MPLCTPPFQYNSKEIDNNKTKEEKISVKNLALYYKTKKHQENIS